MQRIMRLALIVPTVLLALVSFPAIASAQGVTTGAVRGKVLDDGGRPVPGARPAATPSATARQVQPEE